MNHLLRSRVGVIIEAAVAANLLYVQPGSDGIPLGHRCTACLRMDSHGAMCSQPRGLVKSEANAPDMCRWCRHAEADSELAEHPDPGPEPWQVSCCAEPDGPHHPHGGSPRFR